MLAGYAQSGKMPQSYIGLMVSIFSKYPRSVVLRGVEPDGIPRTTKFVPTPADVIGWLEESTRPMHEEHERVLRIERQAIETEEWLKSGTAPEEIERRKALADSWLERTDERARELSGERPKGPLPAEEVDRLIAAARSAAAKINTGEVKLSEEIRDAMRQRDAAREEDYSTDAAIDR